MQIPVTGFGATNVKWSINGVHFREYAPDEDESRGSRAVVCGHAGGLQQCAYTALARQHGCRLWPADRCRVRRGAAQMVTADMVPDMPGIWLYHCHITDHMLAGMTARYEVMPR